MQKKRSDERNSAARRGGALGEPRTGRSLEARLQKVGERGGAMGVCSHVEGLSRTVVVDEDVEKRAKSIGHSQSKRGV